MSEKYLNNKLHYALYRFSTFTTDDDLKTSKQFVRQVRIIQMHFPKDWITYKFYCKQFIFDDIYTTILMRKVAYIFAMLTLRLNLEGQLILVENQQEIQAKWEKVKLDLQRNHKGNVFDDYIKTVDSIVNNQQKLISFLISNQMYGLFFKQLSLMNVKNINDYDVNEIEERKTFIKRTLDNDCYEQFMFQKNNFIEGFIKENNIQNELLWIG